MHVEAYHGSRNYPMRTILIAKLMTLAMQEGAKTVNTKQLEVKLDDYRPDDPLIWASSWKLHKFHMLHKSYKYGYF